MPALTRKHFNAEGRQSKGVFFDWLTQPGGAKS
jgi:hypothetical protein